MDNYNFLKIEKKWREKWENNKSKKNNNNNKPKYYCLDMFPYPSASGLHVGHWRGYVLSDVISRYKLLQGYNVLHPIGFDAFGLPAENYSIKIGMHPEKVTKESIINYKRQLKEISAIYDWDKEINTTDPNYYKWTQWIFIKMFEKGLAYEKEMPLNWCDNCRVVLSNEEAKNGKCDRCGHIVTKKMLRQWMIKITDYAERLLKDLDNLQWPEKVKKMQREWIGKSYGAEINFNIDNLDEKIKVFTTRLDTIYGVSSILLSPEHNLVKKIVTEKEKENVYKYISETLSKSNIKRMSEKEKTGVFTGRYAINPINNKKIQIWISDYVLSDYGSGAIMSVPAHDERDFDFAKKYNLPIIQVIKKYNENNKENNLNKAMEEDGILINSSLFNGIDSKKAKKEIINYLEKHNIGKKTINYKLRDWVFSRQRYWGEPIPLIHCKKCGIVPVPEEDLPIMLPNIEKYQPTETGESPLSNIKDWVNTTCPKCKQKAKRETNTMPQWAGSSWYFLRYPDTNNKKEIISKEKMEKWLPVDVYVGGIEHAVLHLLYARFYTKFLYDIKVINFEEPFKKLFNQGMLNKDGFKMSKSKGNIISPDNIVKDYGCDSLRLYELFIGPPELDIEWDDSGIDGVHRFLKKFWKLVLENKNKTSKKENFDFIRNKIIYEVTRKMEKFTFNTIVSTFMEYTNKLIIMAKENNGIDIDTLETMIILISPFTPHIAEEMWEILGHKNSIFEEKWPIYNLDKLKEKTIEIALQINGKVKDSLIINTDEPEENVLAKSKKILHSKINGRDIVKEIYIPNKIVNIVIK